MEKPILTCLLVTALFTATAHPAAAQNSDTFMLVPGIPGESQDFRHKDWIDVISLSQSFDSTAKGRTPCTVAVIKKLDKAGPLLWAAAVTGQVFSEIKVEIQKAGEKGHKFYELTLFSARVASISSTPNEFVENLTITGASATLTYIPQKEDGTPDTPVTATASCR